MPETTAALRALIVIARQALAQALLGWALNLDARGVMETVYDGIAEGAAHAGTSAEQWRAC